jgi:hypothetical protein
MPSHDGCEHYVTVFDSSFVLSGTALHESLVASGKPFRLWVVAADALAAEQIARFELESTSVIELSEIETPSLRAVKSERTVGEYCWTLTPFLPQAVFDRVPNARRVTYLDADLYFFSSPETLFSELERSGKDVLITKHAYAPHYDREAKNGRFCVQFLTFNNTAGARKVMRWWQARCLEWCYARAEDGKYGDQKYLDSWPVLFAGEVHVLEQVEHTLAPWNVDFYSRGGRARPVFYHFQGFRILSPQRIKIYHGYRVTSHHLWIYDTYLAAIARAASRLVASGYPIPVMPEHLQSLRAVRRVVLRALGRTRIVKLPRPLGARFVLPALARGRAS